MTHNPNVFDLDPETISYIAEYNAQIQSLALSMNAALGLVCRQNHLPGKWQLHPEGRQLIRVDAPVTQEEEDYERKLVESRFAEANRNGTQ